MFHEFLYEFWCTKVPDIGSWSLRLAAAQARVNSAGGKASGSCGQRQAP